MGHHHHHNVREGNRKGLLIALLITLGVMVVEFIGGLVTNSLALLSDAGHMLNDASSLFLSFLALWFATRSASPMKTYGYYRFEILAALLNGITLFLISGFILFEAYERFVSPPTVSSGTMIMIAVIGLFANLMSAWFLMKEGDVKHNVNMKSAYLHVLGDALGSVGAIIAGVLMLRFEWYLADPMISVVVSLLILRSAWGVLKQSIHILMEGSPIDQNEVNETLAGIDGVVNVHDLHIWTITSGFDALSCHIQIQDSSQHERILQEAIVTLKDKFHLEHVTIQVETEEIEHAACMV
ncbi:cation diffusion facilitator family transporter [Bacillus kexueae]|uniref:cation diffusion facilitator family transporter n=1 Tax=Aeribacillus kexueae TaxID=2078952 RepID=UPI001FAF6261|nr:cation diffusion facilitator family transporter [Bacillus kexueae]